MSFESIGTWLNNHYFQVLLALVIVLITILVQFLVSRLFIRFFKRSAQKLFTDPTNYKFLRHAISAMIYIVGFAAAIYVIPSLRTIAHSLLAGAGIMAVAIGFASQQALSNIVSGIFIVVFKPFRVNDMLEISASASGRVEDITLRHTVIRNFENRRVVIPNSIISEQTIINSDIVDEKICRIMNFGIGYSADIDAARKIIQEEAMAHPSFLDNRDEEQLALNEDPVVVRVMGWGDFAINLRAWIWTHDAVKAFRMSCDLYESIKKKFDQEGIEIPFPYRNVVIKQGMEDQTILKNKQDEQ